MNKNEILKQKYFNILSELDESFLNEKHLYSKKVEGLSGLFLASEPENYWTAKNKIMIIGAETRDWNINTLQEYSLDHYLLTSIEKNKVFLKKMINEPRTKKISFHDFTRAVADKSGYEGLIYCNLFSFSWKEKSPIGSKYFKEIHDVSKKLLSAQLNYFQPDIVILATGLSSLKFRREIFSLDKCKDSIDYENEAISKNQLWQFNFDDKYTCYRIQHPSTRTGRKEAQNARNKLLELLPSK
ncbi:hypothetical protein H0S58_06740 [Acinetobacter sp. TTH0-4]|uniref:hypothetical protein n=1 Tax=Acinetobacter sp. TTH0-4 TaxID=1646498 RepID=UPI0018A0507D|nr:hypothetical protein [Acinetobacter sp. TTH0-4]QPF39163.1 hypothetical protein H0S58_06740 [Acinetobacter sp. TTH0-4]